MKSMLDTQPDNLLLECMSRADQSAFEALFVRHYSRVYGVLYSLLGSREASEDLTQETFLELYRHPPTLSAEATLPAWLCRVAVNKGYNSLRGEKRSRQRIESFYTQEDPYAEFQRAEDRTRVREVLVRLQERQSKLLLLR